MPATSFHLSLSQSDLWLCRHFNYGQGVPQEFHAEAALAAGVHQPFLSPKGVSPSHLTFCDWHRKTCRCIGQDLAFRSRISFNVACDVSYWLRNLMCLKAEVEKKPEKFYVFRLLGSLFTEKQAACCWGWNKTFALPRKSWWRPGRRKPGNLPQWSAAGKTKFLTPNAPFPPRR